LTPSWSPQFSLYPSRTSYHGSTPYSRHSNSAGGRPPRSAYVPTTTLTTSRSRSDPTDVDPYPFCSPPDVSSPRHVPAYVPTPPMLLPTRSVPHRTSLPPATSPPRSLPSLAPGRASGRPQDHAGGLRRATIQVKGPKFSHGPASLGPRPGSLAAGILFQATLSAHGPLRCQSLRRHLGIFLPFIV
jgi:hypothetical protein